MRGEKRKGKRKQQQQKDWRRWWSPGSFRSSFFCTVRRQWWSGNYNSHDALTGGSCEREAFSPHNPLRHPRMVAPSGAMSDSENSSSSSSDAEELARCREAATPAWGLEQRPGAAERPEAGAADKQAPAPQPSRRHEVNQHEEDGNDLRTTPEFRAHVAKKLGALLDSSIAIAEVWKKSQKAKMQQAAKEEDGFRLFFTSIPGGHKKEASPRPCRKRQPPSSSDDSDEELQRCREAAVSASDILQESAIHCPAKAEEKKKLKKKAKKKVDNADLAAAPGLEQAWNRICWDAGPHLNRFLRPFLVGNSSPVGSSISPPCPAWVNSVGTESGEPLTTPSSACLLT
uniref:Protein CUSTOS n=1 Tax=Mus spicilegus TaxID=10103 RepID=A0A8C6GWC0_MUSSI